MMLAACVVLVLWCYVAPHVHCPQTSPAQSPVALLCSGDPIPDIEYTPEEVRTWATVLKQLRGSLPKWACKEYLKSCVASMHVLPLHCMSSDGTQGIPAKAASIAALRKAAYRRAAGLATSLWYLLPSETLCRFETLGFTEARPPQLQEMHEALQKATGWSIRPTAGLMHPRDFLNGLAFKYFHSTQYMRHWSNPVYTPEPDVVHELIGHVPMLLNPEYAVLTFNIVSIHRQYTALVRLFLPVLHHSMCSITTACRYCELVEAIGRASLGATDKEIWHLTKVYWYTIEFGVLREGEEIKAFGAGVLSR
jgi:phenylalanine-4-hydroxylase